MTHDERAAHLRDWLAGARWGLKTAFDEATARLDEAAKAYVDRVESAEHEANARQKAPAPATDLTAMECPPRCEHEWMASDVKATQVCRRCGISAMDSDLLRLP
jgi:hypothetical protein